MQMGAIGQIELPDDSCTVFTQANFQQKPHSSITNEETQNGTIFVDLWGPARVQGGRGKYILVVLHSDTRKLFLYTIPTKDKVADLIINMVQLNGSTQTVVESL
jgi:hypothetical protein